MTARHFSSDDGGPEDAPTDGVIVVAVSDIGTGPHPVAQRRLLLLA